VMWYESKYLVCSSCQIQKYAVKNTAIVFCKRGWEGGPRKLYGNENTNNKTSCVEATLIFQNFRVVKNGEAVTFTCPFTDLLNQLALSWPSHINKVIN